MREHRELERHVFICPWCMNGNSPCEVGRELFALYRRHRPSQIEHYMGERRRYNELADEWHETRRIFATTRSAADSPWQEPEFDLHIVIGPQHFSELQDRREVFIAKWFSPFDAARAYRAPNLTVVVVTSVKHPFLQNIPNVKRCNEHTECIDTPEGVIHACVQPYA